MKKGLLTMAGMLLTVSLVSAGTTVPVPVSYTHLDVYKRQTLHSADVRFFTR